MNLPNKLTISRIAVLPLFILFLSINHFLTRLLALIVFLLASTTDTLDGILARKTNTVTNFGKLIDPIADKVLISSAFILFLGIKEVNVAPWVVALIVVREFLITGVRLIALVNGKVVCPTKPGKYKMTLQSLCVLSGLILITVSSFISDILGKKPNEVTTIFLLNQYVFFWMALFVAIFTVASGVYTILKEKEVIVGR